MRHLTLNSVFLFGCLKYWFCVWYEMAGGVFSFLTLFIKISFDYIVIKVTDFCLSDLTMKKKENK